MRENLKIHMVCRGWVGAMRVKNNKRLVDLLTTLRANYADWMVAALDKEVDFSSRGSVGRAVFVQRTIIGITI